MSSAAPHYLLERLLVRLAVRFITVFLGGFLVGALVMYAAPFLRPRVTIYDRLSELQLSFQRHDLYTGSLQQAIHLSQYDSLEWLKRAYDEKQSQKTVYDSLHVYLDIGKNVVWVELWLDNMPTNLEWLGFYFYSDPD